MTRRLSLMITLLAIPVFGYLAVFLYLFLRQDSLIFFPRLAAAGAPNPEAAALGFTRWLDPSGEFLGWKREQPGATHSVLSCHGNGGNATDRFVLAAALSSGPPVNLYLLEYPGYGERSGTPSERSLVNAAVAAVDLLAERPTHSLWLLGESLGSGVASAAAGLRPHRVDGIVLVTPFDSLVGAAQFHYPWIPVGWLMRHRLDSTENLRAFPGPVAIVIAGEDRTTPPILGKKLAASIDSAVRIWEAPGAGHNDTDLLFRPWPEIARWLEESTLKAAR